MQQRVARDAKIALQKDFRAVDIDIMRSDKKLEKAVKAKNAELTSLKKKWCS
jgi:hypothetical protein